MTVLEQERLIETSPGRRPPLEGEAAAGFELAELLTSSTYFGAGVPRGNGRTVIVLPGFLGNDEYLRLLRGWLRRVGYDARASGIAFNWGTPSVILRSLLERVDHIAKETPDQGQGRFIVVGHSLGGLFARAIALERPELVAHAVCLGSPIHGDPRSASHPLVSQLGRALLSEQGGQPANNAIETFMLESPLPESVRLTSLYSRRDAVVDWRSCLDPDPNAAAIEVHGTHCGLAWNREVYGVLGRLLASTGY